MPPDPPETGSDPYRDEWSLTGPALVTDGQRRSSEEGFFNGQLRPLSSKT